MVRIRQHGENGTFFDLNTFFEDVACFVEVKLWRFSVHECMGEGGDVVERLGAVEPAVVDSPHMRELYRGIYQTVDGWFVGLSGGQPSCRLVAVDSSFWEISGSPAFEAYMLAKYGAYEPRSV